MIKKRTKIPKKNIDVYDDEEDDVDIVVSVSSAVVDDDDDDDLGSPHTLNLKKIYFLRG